MVLILIARAHAATLEAEASTAMLLVTSGYGSGTEFRSDLGVALGITHLRLVAAASLHQGPGDLTSFGEPPQDSPILGDFMLFKAGPGVALLKNVGRWRFGGHVDAGLVHYLCPVDTDAYTTELIPAGADTQLGTESNSAFIQGGGDAGLAIIPGHAWINLHQEIGTNLLPGIAPVYVATRLGLSAAL